MSDIKESAFDRNYRRILSILKKLIKLWFFTGIVFTVLFQVRKIDVVKENIPKPVQEQLWGWYEDIKKDKM